MDEKRILPLFSELINDVMYPEVKSNKRLVEGLEGTVKCSMRDIQRYRTGEQVPGYGKALAILNFLKIDVSADDLVEILKQSRRHAHDLREGRTTGYRKVSMTASHINLGIELDAVQLSEVIGERVRRLYGESGTVKEYIEDLISKDLRDEIL